MVMTEQQRPPIKLVTYTNSTHGATPVRIQAAAKGRDVARRAKRRPRRIIQSPIIAPNQAPSIDSEATHEASCCVTERTDLRQIVGAITIIITLIIATNSDDNPGRDTLDIDIIDCCCRSMADVRCKHNRSWPRRLACRVLFANSFRE